MRRYGSRITQGTARLSWPVWLVAAGLGAMSVGPAWAGECYDVFGCTDTDVFKLNDLLDGPNCDFLWTMRNQIFKDHGYCFKTERGIATFGNDGCTANTMTEAGLSPIESANVTTIQKAEKAMSCP
jgi:hypothetical protein